MIYKYIYIPVYIHTIVTFPLQQVSEPKTANPRLCKPYSAKTHILTCSRHFRNKIDLRIALTGWPKNTLSTSKSQDLHPMIARASKIQYIPPPPQPPPPPHRILGRILVRDIFQWTQVAETLNLPVICEVE